MFYTIYKTTNHINGKFYIGKHQTKDLNDGYMGSGRLLKAAIKKYGADNFHKEILHVVQTEKEMDLLEKILVVPDPEINYNLCQGGKGGWSFINTNGLQKTEKQKESARNHNLLMRKSKEWLLGTRERHLKIIRKRMENNSWNTVICSFRNRKHSDETKKKIGKTNSLHQTGSKNSQYGTCWITNGQVNKKIKKEELDNWLELGYYKGRI